MKKDSNTEDFQIKFEIKGLSDKYLTKEELKDLRKKLAIKAVWTKEDLEKKFLTSIESEFKFKSISTKESLMFFVFNKISFPFDLLLKNMNSKVAPMTCPQSPYQSKFQKS